MRVVCGQYHTVGLHRIELSQLLDFCLMGFNPSADRQVRGPAVGGHLYSRSMSPDMSARVFARSSASFPTHADATNATTDRTPAGAARPARHQAAVPSAPRSNTAYKRRRQTGGTGHRLGHAPQCQPGGSQQIGLARSPARCLIMVPSWVWRHSHASMCWMPSWPNVFSPLTRRNLNGGS
jgi:hypothetical protein